MILRTAISTGWYCDALPNGAQVVLLPSSLQTTRGPVAFPLNQPVLFPRLAADGVRFAGQGGRDGGAWLWTGSVWENHGPTLGVSPCIFDAHDQLVIVSQPGTVTGSQGWRQVSDAGILITADSTHVHPVSGLHEYSTFGDVVVGQGGNGGCLATVAGRLVLLEPGLCYTIRLRHDGTAFSAAFYKTPGPESVILRFSRADLEALPTYVAPVPPAAIVPINRPCWAGFFNTRQHALTPGNCELWVDPAGTRVVRDKQQHAAVVLYVSGSPETDLGSLNAAIAAAKGHGLPVLAYWPKGLWAGPLPTGADWLGIDGTQADTQTDASLEQGLRAQFARHPAPTLIGQCYTNAPNPGLVQDLTHLPPIYSRILHDFPHAPAVLAFSGYDRATGYNDHPDVQPLWNQWFATAQTPPTPVPPDPPHPQPPEPPMPAPRTVGFLTWIKKFITNEHGGDDVGLVVANDRTDAAGHVMPQVVYAWQEMRVTPIRDIKVTVQATASLRYWAAEDANTTVAMSPTATITCKRLTANLNDDSWELFDRIDNGDGTFSLKSQFGFYVSVQPDGSVLCNRTAIGPYEKLVELPPGSGVPQPPQPPTPGDPIPMVYANLNDHCFRLGDGTPWRMKGITGFKLAELWRTGADWRGFLNAYPGYNTVWTFDYTEGPNWTDAPWESLPVDRCVQFIRDVGAVGWRVAHCLLTSSNPARRQHALDLIAAFKAAKLTNLFQRGANEPEVQHDGIYIETEFMHQALADSGYPYCNGVYKDVTKHYGNWLETHTLRDNEWVRRCHDALDIYHPPSDAPAGTPAKQMPIVMGEPAKWQDVVFSVPDWKAYFGAGSFFGAGCVFHSLTGKFCDLPTDQEKQLAAAALMGMNAYPADAPTGPYSRVDDSTLRTYIVGAASVRMRPTTPNHPQAGWTSLETDHILWKR